MTRKRFIGVIVAALALLVVVLAPNDRAQAQVSFGTNWFGEFYDNTDFALPLAATSTYVNGLNFNFAGQPLGGNGQVLAVGADNWSAIFTTTENFVTSGVYTFSGEADDQVFVLIDGQLAFTQQTPGFFSFQYNVTAGARLVQVGFVELSDTAILRIQWEFSGVLGTPGPVGPTGPQGRVVNVSGLSLRTGPYLGASRIGVLRPDNQYTVLAKNNDESILFTWYKVVAGEQVGWTSGRYFIVDGNTELIPEEASEFQTIEGLPASGVTGVTRAVMNYRRRPSIRSERFTQLPWGAQVDILARTIQGGENYWFYVRYGEQVGWIFAPYVGINGPIEAVPIL